MPRKHFVGKSNRIKLEFSCGVATTATQRVFQIAKGSQQNGNLNKE